MVNDCYAHNGANKRIPLIDHHGCPIDEKLISRFQGTWGMTDNMYDTLIYAHMKTFRFTGTPALYIECDIRMCHGKCPVSWSKVAHFLTFKNIQNIKNRELERMLKRYIRHKRITL